MSDVPRDKLIANGGTSQTLRAVDLIVQALGGNMLEHVGQKNYTGAFELRISYRKGQISGFYKGDAVNILLDR